MRAGALCLALAAGIRLPRVRAYGLLRAQKPAAHPVQRLPPADLGLGWDDLHRFQAGVENLAIGHASDHPGQERHLFAGALPPAGYLPE